MNNRQVRQIPTEIWTFVTPNHLIDHYLGKHQEDALKTVYSTLCVSATRILTLALIQHVRRRKVLPHFNYESYHTHFRKITTFLLPNTLLECYNFSDTFSSSSATASVVLIPQLNHRSNILNHGGIRRAIRHIHLLATCLTAPRRSCCSWIQIPSNKGVSR